MWNLGKVEELLAGADGECRAAVVKVASQGRSVKYLRRPVQRLYPLEILSLKGQSKVPMYTSDHNTPNINEDGSQSQQEETVTRETDQLR